MCATPSRRAPRREQRGRDAGGQCETASVAGRQRDQLVEGSAPGVPRDEVGLAEQWELLLLLLQELCVLEPAMRWTTGFWAKSTPARHGEERRKVRG